MKKKTLVSWSSGKESAWALHTVLRNPERVVAGLFCTVNRAFDRVAMHGVRIDLVKRQAKSVGLPLEIIEIPYPCSDGEYEVLMARFVERARADHVEHFVFGDLFLEDVRGYREEKLKGCGIEPLFPLWGMPTHALSREMIRSGLRMVITCIDPKQAPAECLGKEFDESLLDSLPESVDPCGENGEFHGFVFDGPMFRERIEITVGEIVHRDGLVFADLLPKNS
ncbi:MAG: Dph6-related ATP pyrophosphatase [Planctomycetota bacterium]|jgi:uncharacterized protein (TIGR00290 family)